MAHIASINGSTAGSPPSSQVANPPAPGSPEAEFLAMLTHASSSTNSFMMRDTSGVSTSHGSSSAVNTSSDSPANQLEARITQLLGSGVSIEKITTAIASKLVSLSGGQPGANTSARVKAVANYLRQGESSSQDPAKTAKDIADKVKSLLAGLQQQKSTSSTNTTSQNDSGNILDALQAGETPTAPTNPTAQTPTSKATPNAALSTDGTSQATPAADSTTALFAAALVALQAPGATQTTATPPTSSTGPVTSDTAASATEVDQSALGTTLAQLTQSASGQSMDTSQQANQTQAAATLRATASANGSASSSTQVGAVSGTGDSSLQVGTDLAAIAAGQGTALGRALLRAVNVDVARSSANVGNQMDATLSSVTASLDNLFASLDASSGRADKAIASAGASGSALDSTLGDASLALMNPNASSTTQTDFASTLAKTQAPVNVDDIMDQVVHGISIKNFTDNPTVNIALNPPHLGELNVKLTVHDQTVNATVITQTSEARSILLDNRAQLDQVLANAGLKLGSLNVDVSGQGLQQEADRRQAQREQVFTSSASANVLDSATDATSTQAIGPSMLGSVDLSLLNQLV